MEGFSEPNLINNTAYNELALAQEHTVFFHIAEEAKTRANKYGDARHAWMKLSRKVEPTRGASKTRLRKKFPECELNDVTRNPK